jgi:LysM repeat protein
VGDNLFRIALRNGLTTNELAVANGITNPSLIFVGTRIGHPNSRHNTNTSRNTLA